MNAYKFQTLMTLGFALALAGSGCKHAPVGVTHIPGRNDGGVGETGGKPYGGTPEGTGVGNPISTDTPTGIPANPPGSHDHWNRDTGALAAHTVHFAYDSSVVRSDDKSNIAAVADYLKSNSAAAVEVEGYCDERGTDGYNMALGERRASAVREALVALGIDATRVDTKSFGRENPVDPGHTEAAWSKNRRGEFVVLTPP